MNRTCAFAVGFLVLLAILTMSGCDLIPTVPLVPPDRAPTGVTATMADLQDAVEVRWQPVERAEQYEIYRSPTGTDNWVRVGSSSGLSFTDSGVERAKLYWYKVRACNRAGCGPESGPVVGYAQRPPAPQNVRASTHLPDRIEVEWDPVPGATYYQVFRDRVPDGHFPTPVTQTEQTTATDTTAALTLDYWYKVRACRDVPGKGTACSTLSEPARGCRAPCPPMMTEE